MLEEQKQSCCAWEDKQEQPHWAVLIMSRVQGCSRVLVRGSISTARQGGDALGAEDTQKLQTELRISTPIA